MFSKYLWNVKKYMGIVNINIKNYCTVNQKPCLNRMKRYYSTCPAGMKVTICGAAGCTGSLS